MIEKTVLDFMTAELDVPVYMEIPDEPTGPFVVIEKVGATRTNFLYDTSLAFQSYSLTSMYEAAALDERVREAADRLPELAEISGAYLASNYNFTDTRTKRYRYQCTYEVYHF